MNLKVNGRGLVVMKVLRAFGVYKGGQIAGFEPPAAKTLLEKGYAELYGESAPTEADKSAVEKKPEGGDKFFVIATAEGTVSIPENWTKEHHNKRIAWAKEIKPDAESLNSEGANQIIAETVKDQEAA